MMIGVFLEELGDLGATLAHRVVEVRVQPRGRLRDRLQDGLLLLGRVVFPRLLEERLVEATVHVRVDALGHENDTDNDNSVVGVNTNSNLSITDTSLGRWRRGLA